MLADVHRVLVAAGDPRADDVARRAGAYLQEQAERIRDDDLRASFLAAPVSSRLAKIAASAAGESSVASPPWTRGSPRGP